MSAQNPFFFFFLWRIILFWIWLPGERIKESVNSLTQAVLCSKQLNIPDKRILLTHTTLCARCAAVNQEQSAFNRRLKPKNAKLPPPFLWSYIHPSVHLVQLRAWWVNLYDFRASQIIIGKLGQCFHLFQHLGGCTTLNDVPKKLPSCPEAL